MFVALRGKYILFLHFFLILSIGVFLVVPGDAIAQPEEHKAELLPISSDTIAEVLRSWFCLCPPVSDTYGYRFTYATKTRPSPLSQADLERGEGVYIRKGPLEWADIEVTLATKNNDPPKKRRTWLSIGKNGHYEGYGTLKGCVYVQEMPAPGSTSINQRYGTPGLDMYYGIRRFMDLLSGIADISEKDAPPRDFWRWPAPCQQEEEGIFRILLESAASKDHSRLAFYLYTSSLAADARLVGWDEGIYKGASFEVRSSFRLSYSKPDDPGTLCGVHEIKYKRTGKDSDTSAEDSSRVLMDLSFHLEEVLSPEVIAEAPMTIYLPQGSAIRTVDGNTVHVGEKGREIRAD